MLKLRVAGVKTAEIAKQFNVSHDTVDRTLSWGERAGLFAQYEDQILVNIVPAALKAIYDAMLDGDAQVALETLKLYHAPKQSAKQSTKSNNSSDSDSSGSEDLMLFVKQLRDASQASIDDVEGEIVDQSKLIGTGTSAERIGDAGIGDSGGRNPDQTDGAAAIQAASLCDGIEQSGQSPDAPSESQGVGQGDVV